MDMNLLVAAAMSLSLIVSRIQTPEIKIPFTAFYSLFVVAQTISLGVGVHMAISYNGESIVSLRSKCRPYYNTMISTITIGLLQTIISCLIPTILMSKHGSEDSEVGNDEGRYKVSSISPGVASITYIPAILAIPAIERLKKSAVFHGRTVVDGITGA